jgi:3-hydroxyisobutyrate dehydrogenase
MALNLMKAGYALKVYNRSDRPRVQAVVDAGAERVATPREAAEGCTVIITMVTDTPDVEAVVLGEDGVVHGAAPGTSVIDMSTVSPRVTREIAAEVGFVGLGIMGAPMALNLMKAGYALKVYNRSDRPRVQAVVDAGAERVATPREAAEGCTVIITMVTDTPDVEAVVLGEDGVVHGAAPGTSVIDMSTVSPRVTREIAAELESKGIDMLDAPVSGGDVGARNATLSIMVGGKEEVFNECLPVFEAMGKSINLIGGNGAGQTTKLCNQIAVSVNNLAMAEALMLAAGSDLDVKKVLDAISGGAAGSWQLSNLGPRILDDDFAPGFMVKLQQKDLKLVLQAANDVKLALPGAGLAHQFFNIVERAGGAEEGTQALIKAYEMQADKQARSG